ncbi:MAG: C40 family peptidase [Rubrobacter sp.]|nr:C40 family peptidase [Rubrobacter sp.]
MWRFAALFAGTLFVAAAFALGSSTEAEAQTGSGQAVVDEARGYIGAPYSYAGADAAYGISCSAFTQEVFGKFGVALPIDPAGQFGYGVPSDGQAGDLVFFDEGGFGISHVGIATGHGTVIHASDYYGQVIESPIEFIPGYAGAQAVV